MQQLRRPDKERPVPGPGLRVTRYSAVSNAFIFDHAPIVRAQPQGVKDGAYFGAERAMT